jgi:hypothetical protein
MVKDKDAMEKAAIHVERINGPVFLLSATQDEYWPSKEMSGAIIARLKKSEFRFNAEHVAIEGKHGAPLEHMNLVEGFLQRNFLAESSKDCPRIIKSTRSGTDIESILKLVGLRIIK